MPIVLQVLNQSYCIAATTRVVSNTCAIFDAETGELLQRLEMPDSAVSCEYENGSLYWYLLDGSYANHRLGSATISRDTAVFGPAMITAACLLMMMCSKRTLYPFMISVFSLCLPLVIWFFSIYPM